MLATMSLPTSFTFHTTRWSRVVLARESSTEGQEALRQLCAAYYAPVIAFLRREGRAEDEARDLAHDFFATVLAGSSITQAEQSRGRFRSYLLGAVKHFLSHRREGSDWTPEEMLALRNRISRSSKSPRMPRSWRHGRGVTRRGRSR
jgi:DNA-directed RNA polymerase specialized sigma24 family protein